MHSTIIADAPSPDTDDLLPYIPEDLRQYLVTTERPQEIYQFVDREHDRRVRLLLRRFTNQIQYGCTNPRCNVPTCLSYRKRASRGPLRPHNDLTARALAVKCLEQYATHGRDLARYPHRDKGKKKQIGQGSDGLCWNEPVVPWYTDPNEHFARKNALARRRSSGGNKVPTSTSKAVVSTPATQPASPKTKGDKECLGALGTHDTVERPRTSVIEESCSELAQKIDKSHSQPISMSKSGHSPYANGHAKETAAGKTGRPRPSYDQASLPQSLFKHPRLQFLNKPPSTPNPDIESTQESPERIPWVNAVKQPVGIEQSTPSLGLLHAHPHVTTFRILPPKAIQWFKEMFTQSREESGPAPKRLRSFLDQCLFFVIGSPTRLLQTTSTWSGSQPHKKDKGLLKDCSKSRLVLPGPEDFVHICGMIAQCFDDSDRRFHIATHVLWALQHCYALPHYIKQSGNLRTSPQGHHKFLSSSEIAHLILVVLSMIGSAESSWATTQPTQDGDHFRHTSGLLGSGQPLWTRDALAVTPSFKSVESDTRSLYDSGALNQYHTESCQLCEAVADLISHRVAIDSATEALRSRPVEAQYSHGIISEIISLMQNSMDNLDTSLLHNRRSAQMLAYMQRVVFMKWDRTPVVRRTGPIGGALEMLKGLFVRRRHLSLDEMQFYMECIPAALDEVEMPFEWLSFKPDATKMHILQFSFLFPPKMIVRYFRSLNLKIMKQSHEKAMAIYTNGRTQLLHQTWTVANIDEVLNLTRSHMARYFVMTIRRSDILEDAIGQIWQRERRELLRPLKVTLGKEEGENGLDHGGVQQEFFRLAFAEAFDPNYGMFDVDPTTRMTWFKPGAFEQMYKYEALGILMSLAIYNGITIPITMPLAFYRKILGLKVRKIEHIEDGWPELAQSFSQLLAWNEGDVEDVMALTYDFSYDAFGKTVTVDMSNKQTRVQTPTNPKQSLKGKERASSFTIELTNGRPNYKPVTSEPISSSSDTDTTTSHEDNHTQPPTPVTNANRHAFVHSYIIYLTTTTIQPQFTSFLKGLHTLLSPAALSLFTPSHLKLLFEGHPTTHPLSIPSWRATTKYEDFTADEPLILWFWDILENDFSQTQLRQLLEFVTASNRVPVGGWEGVTFIVQRNGGGDERLPGSSTCYGRLLLPEYSCRKVLKERLTKAVEEGLGFGMI